MLLSSKENPTVVWEGSGCSGRHFGSTSSLGAGALKIGLPVYKMAQDSLQNIFLWQTNMVIPLKNDWTL